MSDLIAVELTEQERVVPRGGVNEWGGPARCTEEFAIAMGFRSVADLFDTRETWNADPRTDWLIRTSVM